MDGTGTTHRIGWKLAMLLVLAASACGGGTPAADGIVEAGVADADLDAAPGAGGGSDGGMWSTAEAALSPAGSGRLVPAEVVDESGFGQPMVAVRLQVPADWRTAGGVRWNDGADCFSGQVRAAWAAVGPDGASVFELLPGYVWQLQGTEIPTDPCPVASYRSAREFLEAVAQQARPGSRVLDYSDWPELADRVEEKARRNAEPPAQGQQRRYEAGRLLIAYRADGVDTREVLAAAVAFWSLQRKRDGSVGQVLAYRAPNGRLDFDLLERIAGSIEEDPQWFALARDRVKGNVERYFAAQRRDIDAWHARRMAEINARGEADRAAIRMGAMRDVAAIRSQTHANTMATNDRIHARTIDGIYERNAYAGLHGGTVYGSIHGGSRVFQSTTDPNQAWSTDDPYADPSNAVELERAR